MMDLFTRRLVLFARQHPREADVSLAEIAHATGLAGAAIDALGTGHYAPGPAFTEAVMFLGCSPAVELGGPTDASDPRPNLYHVEIPERATGATLISDANTRPPRCPACGALADTLPITSGADDTVVCDACGETAALSRWRWRRQAAFGPCVINIWGVHEGEAVPADALLTALCAATGIDWDYAYLHHAL